MFRFSDRVVSIDKDLRRHHDVLGCQCPVSLAQHDAHHCALHIGIIFRVMSKRNQLSDTPHVVPPII